MTKGEMTVVGPVERTPGAAIAIPERARAGFVSRFIAFAIDICVLALGVGASHWFIETLENVLRPWATLDLSALVYAAIPLIVIVYYVGFWCLFGQTVGKWLLGLRVVSQDGRRVTLAHGLLRFVGYLVSALPLYGGYFWVLFDKQRRAVHDHLARTAVVYVRAPRRSHREPSSAFQLAEVR